MGKHGLREMQAASSLGQVARLSEGDRGVEMPNFDHTWIINDSMLAINPA
jgi:hypothetical protein